MTKHGDDGDGRRNGREQELSIEEATGDGSESDTAERGEAFSPWRSWVLGDRPQSFDDLIGHDSIRDALKARVVAGSTQNHVIFHGAKGVGTRAISTLYGQAIVCTSPKLEERPCRSCPACEDFESEGLNGTWYDLKEMLATYKRSALRDMNDLPLTAINCKNIEKKALNDLEEYVFGLSGKITAGSLFVLQTHSVGLIMIDNADLMSATLADRFLHALEVADAPMTCIFVTTDISKLRPALRSRCQAYRVTTLDRAGSIKRLSQACTRLEITSQPAVLELVAARAGDSEEALIKFLWKVYHAGPATIQQARTALGLDWVEQVSQALSAVVTGDLEQIRITFSHLGNDPRQALKRLRVTIQALDILEHVHPRNHNAVLPSAFMYTNTHLSSSLLEILDEGAARLGRESGEYRNWLMDRLNKIHALRSTATLAEVVWLSRAMPGGQ